MDPWTTTSISDLHGGYQYKSYNAYSFCDDQTYVNFRNAASMADLEAVLYDSSGCHLYYDTGDERIASIAQANQYEINVPGKLAQSDLELPDDSQICF